MVRDWKDRVIVTGTRVEGNTIVYATEAKWFRCAVLLSQDLNLRKVVIEGDSKVCIDAFNKVLKGEKPIFVPWEALCFIEDSYDMAKEQDSMKFSWLKHKANLPETWKIFHNIFPISPLHPTKPFPVLFGYPNLPLGVHPHLPYHDIKHRSMMLKTQT